MHVSLNFSFLRIEAIPQLSLSVACFCIPRTSFPNKVLINRMFVDVCALSAHGTVFFKSSCSTWRIVLTYAVFQGLAFLIR